MDGAINKALTMHFNSTLALLLLTAVPIFIYLGLPSRGYGRRREVASLILRCLIVLFLILSLAGIEATSLTNNLAVVFLLDVSDSMSEAAQAEALEFVQRSIESMPIDDQAALIVFGGDALVERGMSPARDIGVVNSIPTTHQTDLAQAINLALALYPPDSARRMVILSDGIVTTGDAARAASYAASTGVEILVLPFSNSQGEEILLTNIDAPERLSVGEHFDLNLSIQSTMDTQATIRVMSDGSIIYESIWEIYPGSHTVSVPLIAGEPGFSSFQVQLISQDDTYYQNNELTAYTQISGPPTVLLIGMPPGELIGFSGVERPDEFSPLTIALEAAGYTVEIAPPSGLPSELTEMAGYAAIILVDVPARELSTRQMETLQNYIRDLGGGLVTVGGPTSYGVGGYYRTQLEELLPLNMQITDEERRPSLAIVFIIDHSGSMSEVSGGVAKLELAKEAAMRSIELLIPTDRVGVVAFDETASWVVEMTDLNNPQAVIQAIGTIRAGGGTDILAGVQAVANVLPDDPALVRHIILLTDGGADPTGIPELVEQLYTEHGITLSTVGVGRDAAPFLPTLAEIGGGRYHFTADPSTIPAIFTEETTLATRAYIIEESFYPQLYATSPILAGISELPPLLGYVGTSPKETAQTILVSRHGDPILAAWQYGLGRVVSFTSDATGRWALSWLGWEGFPTFWGQAVDYTIGNHTISPLSIQITEIGEEALLTVEASESNISSGTSAITYLNDIAMLANIVAPNGEVMEVRLSQSAPGLYVGNFFPEAQGTYLIRVSGETGHSDGLTVAESVGWVLSYSPEYRLLTADPSALIQLATENGGGIAPSEPTEIFRHTLPPVIATRPLWRTLLTASALLLPLDIALRRLVISWRQVKERLSSFIVSIIKMLNVNRSPVVQHSQQIKYLLKIKTHTQRSQPKEAKTSQDVEPSRQPQSPTGYATLNTSEHQPTPIPNLEQSDEQPANRVSQSPEIKPTSGHQTTAAHLLARKRAREDKDRV